MRAKLLLQTLAGLFCAMALYLLAWNEVAALRDGSLFSLLPGLVDSGAGAPAARHLVRVLATLLAVGGSFFCLAGMGNTLGLISLFGGRIALSARLTGAVLGLLLALAAAALGHFGADTLTATLLVTPLASVLLLLLWQHQRADAPSAVRPPSSAAAPVLLDLPEAGRPPAPRRTEPVLAPAPVPAATGSPRPAVFTARAPRAGDGNPELTPLDFDGSRGLSSKGRGPIEFGRDLGLPPLEFTPSSVPGAAPPKPAPAAAPASPQRPQSVRPERIPASPVTPKPQQPERPAPAPSGVPGPTTLTLESLDFSAAPLPRPTAATPAPLADELAQWSPQPLPEASPVRPAPPVRREAPAPGVPGPVRPPKPAPVAAQTTALPAVAPTPSRAPGPPDDIPDTTAQVFTLDTVAPREQGPRRALLDEEPDLLAQLGSLSQVATPPAAPVGGLLSAASPANPGAGPAPAARTTSPPSEPERIKLADKGVFSIYKLVRAGQGVGYALTERGLTVTVGTQEQVKQALRDRWPGTG